MHSGPVKQCVLLSQDVGMGSRTLARVMVCHLSVHSMHATVWQGRSTVPLSDLIAFVCLDDKKEPPVQPPSAQVCDCHGRVCDWYSNWGWLGARFRPSSKKYF